jgi:REP element-mobilizing transposase RayT
MPNHVHIILYLRLAGGQDSPTVSRIIQQWKGIITKKAGFAFWQKSFHDILITNRTEYQRIANYITNNPRAWTTDQYYVTEITM